MDNIPTYKVVVNPDDELTGVYAVSLVGEPAIEVDWIALSKINLDNFIFSVEPDKQVLYGPLLIPDKKILRRDENGSEYNIVFDKTTIQVIADKYNEKKLGDIFNMEHSDIKVEGYLSQNWITGSMDKSKELGFDLPDGSWFGAVKIKDKNFWNNDIKNGKLKGFSVELKAGIELIQMTTSVDKNKLNSMEYKTKDGMTLTWEGDAAVGKDIFIVLEDGTKAPLADGEYELEDGTKVVAKGGKVDNIIAAAKMEEELQVPAPTDPAFEASVKTIITPMFDELRMVVADLKGRIDMLEAQNNQDQNAMDNPADYKKEYMEKLNDLQTQIENLSKSAGTVSIKELTDLDKAKVEKYEDTIRKINFYKKK
ncbi:hypothetical protein EBR66_08245 [bacterium]|nr:hypothetical protein [bacterium]